jgi:LmbE family N-acetylglucosaminyl deacetylase
MSERRNILVIAPHPDDEAVGCGGTICLHAERGDRVVAVFLTSGELGLKQLPRDLAWRVREEEARAAANVLGLSRLDFLRCPDWFLGEAMDEAATALCPVLERESPERIYMPHEKEWHPDHQVAGAVVRSALSRLGMTAVELWAYEIWTPLATYDEVQDISTTMSRKLRAIRCYHSQLKAFAYDRAIRGLNQYRGVLAARCRYAEVFQQGTAVL